MSDHQTPKPTAARQEQEAAGAFATEHAAAGEELAAPACDGPASEPPACENSPAVPVGEQLPAPESEKPAAAPMGERLLMALSGPVSSAPDGAGRALVSAGISNKTLQRLPPQIRSAMQIIARRPPVIAGQSAADYYELLEMIMLDWRPGSYEGCSIVKQLADSEWQVFTFQEVQKWLFNAEIAESLVAQIADVEGATSGEQKSDRNTPQNSSGGPTFTETLRTARRVVFAAVAGNTRAIDVLENKVGIGPVAMGPHFAEQFAARIPAHIFADRGITAALARRDAAFRQLLKLAAERWKRIESKKVTVEDIRATLSPSEYIRLGMETFPTGAHDKSAGQGT